MFRHREKDIYTGVASLQDSVQQLSRTNQYQKHMRKCVANKGLSECFHGLCWCVISYNKTGKGLENGQPLASLWAGCASPEEGEGHRSSLSLLPWGGGGEGQEHAHASAGANQLTLCAPRMKCAAAEPQVQTLQSANCRADFVQPLGDDQSWYLLVTARRDIRPRYSLIHTSRLLTLLYLSQEATEALSPGYAAVPCQCRKRDGCESGKGFLVKLPAANDAK